MIRNTRSGPRRAHFLPDGRWRLVDFRLFSGRSERRSRTTEPLNLGVCLLADRWLMGNLTGFFVSFRGRNECGFMMTSLRHTHTPWGVFAALLPTWEGRELPQQGGRAAHSSRVVALLLTAGTNITESLMET